MRKNFRYSLVAVVALIAVSTSSVAAAPVWFDGADTDRDSRLTWTEYVRAQSKFEILDENGDGQITAGDRFIADGLDESSWVYAASMDENQSGAVTWAEYHGQLRKAFASFIGVDPIMPTSPPLHLHRPGAASRRGVRPGS